MPDTPVVLDLRGAVAILRIDRPEALNALSSAVRRGLIDGLARLDADPAIRVAILTGTGRAFSAGLDVRELAAAGRDVSAEVDAENVVAAIERFSKPLIVAVNGLAVTGGLEITLACDIVLAAEEATFADTHVKVGLTPGWGLSQRLARVVGVHRAKELSFTARTFSAREAASWGIVNEVVPAAELLDRAVALAGDIACWPPEGVARMKAMIDGGLARPFGEALAWEAVQASRANAAVTIAVPPR